VDLVHTVVVESQIFVGVVQQAVVADGHVRQSRGLGHAVGHVDAEPVDAAVQPEPQRVGEVLAHLRVRPVQVGLRGSEGVQVPLAG